MRQDLQERKNDSMLTAVSNSDHKKLLKSKKKKTLNLCKHKLEMYKYYYKKSFMPQCKLAFNK